MAGNRASHKPSTSQGEAASDPWVAPDKGVGNQHGLTSAEETYTLYASLVDNLPVYVVRKDREGRITFINHRFAKLLGRSATDVLGKTDFDLYPPQLAEKYRQDDLRVMETNQEFVDVEENRAEGETCYFEVRKTPVHDAEGAVIGAQAIFWDVTDQKRAEDALEYERFLLRSLMDHLPDSIYFKDAGSRFIRASKGLAAKFYLTDPAEVVGKSDADFFAEEHAAEARADEQQVMRTQTPILGKVEKETWSDGRQTWCSTTKMPLRDPQGAVVGTFGITRDITDLISAEQALARERDTLRTLMDNLPDFIYVKDAEGRYEIVNEAVRKILGAPSVEGVVGKTNADFLSANEAAEELSDDQDVLRSGTASLDREERIVDQDGNELWLLTSKVPLRNAAGELVGLVGIDRNITKLKRAQEQLVAAKDAADAANRAKSDFLANMSHEIRTPMNAIIGMTDLLLDTKLSATQREYLDMVQESGEALLTLINDILDFSKIEAGKLELEEVVFDLREQLGDTMKSLALRAHGQGLELAFHVAADVPDGLQGDIGRLRQIVVNLVGNAIKFTEHGEVLLEVSCVSQAEQDAVLLFTVTDTGVGIPTEKCEEVFEEFQQADSSTTRRFGGTGLGLAISARLVKLMQGRIWVESEVGRGSKFHFTTRLAVAPAIAPRPRAPAHLDTQDLPILIVDDNATNRRILHDMLTNWGMQPLTAANAEEAVAHLQTARERSISLVISDVNMPDVDGYTLAKQIREDASLGAPAIIFLTSGVRTDDNKRWQHLGVTAQLMKPIKQSELFDAIVTSLDSVAPDFSAETTERAAPSQEMAPLRILLAEDNLVNQKLAVGALQGLGHHVTVANNGKEAVEALTAGDFDLVLMDVQMPEMDGLSATRAIREQEQQTGAHVPIVAMTAHAMKGDREICLEAGMDDYISKPIRVRALADKLACVCSGRPSTDFKPASAAPERTVAPQPADDLVDFDEALKSVNGDRALLREVILAFLEDTPQLVQAVRGALADQDAAGLRRAAHSLKGSLLFLNVDRQIELAQHIESRAAEGELDGLATDLEVLENEMDRLVATLTEFTRQEA